MLYPAELLAHMRDMRCLSGTKMRLLISNSTCLIHARGSTHPPQHCNQKNGFCQSVLTHFLFHLAYNGGRLCWGGGAMRECDDYTVDLDDLIYDEEDGRPSER